MQSPWLAKPKLSGMVAQGMAELPGLEGVDLALEAVRGFGFNRRHFVTTPWLMGETRRDPSLLRGFQVAPRG
jgi:hypothetical protein